MTSKELIKLLQKEGWISISQKGSHLKMKKGNQIIIIPIHNTDLKPGLLNKLLKQTGLKGDNENE